jgi:hypothetical protein
VNRTPAPQDFGRAASIPRAGLRRNSWTGVREIAQHSIASVKEMRDAFHDVADILHVKESGRQPRWSEILVDAVTERQR